MIRIFKNIRVCYSEINIKIKYIHKIITNKDKKIKSDLLISNKLKRNKKINYKR